MHITDFDATAPIVVVGAGRSGTTRLVGALGEHPDVYMINETSFLLPRLWAAFHERPEFVRTIRLGQLARQTRPDWRAMPWGTFWREELGRDLAAVGSVLGELEAIETARLQRAFGTFFADTLIPPSLRKPRWGFKEIWAGGEAFQYDWTLYRAAFPNACYIQSIRHPLAYLRSFVSNLSAPCPDDDAAAYALRQWVAMVLHARTLRETGRYLEFRMEDFDAELPRILEALELSPAAGCTAAGVLIYEPSVKQAVPVSPAAIARVEGLRALAEELDYSLEPDRVLH
jgi:hypothetical protein